MQKIFHNFVSFLGKSLFNTLSPLRLVCLSRGSFNYTKPILTLRHTLIKKDKVWKKHELTIVAIGIWIFLGTLAISLLKFK